jgi:hypothetical protein
VLCCLLLVWSLLFSLLLFWELLNRALLFCPGRWMQLKL